MSRQTRHEYLAAFTKIPLLFELAKKPAAKRSPRVAARPKRWRYLVPAGGDVSLNGVVRAHTRSEARAAIKQRHGLVRVPVGAEIERIE
jgi:hypothetical protein